MKSSYFHDCIRNAQCKYLKNKVSIPAKENGYKEMGIKNMSLQRLYDSCLLLCTAITCMFWNQKSRLLSPLTTEGMSAIPVALVILPPRETLGTILVLLSSSQFFQ